MLRTQFERGLRSLEERILALGSSVENNIVDVVDALNKRDLERSQQLIANDQIVNRKRIEIMNDALVLIATQQPMAGDMRLIASVLEITGELERINDYVKGIARISIMIGQKPLPDVLPDMPLMAEKARFMLHRALDAASLRDVDLARQIPAADDEIDELFQTIYQRIMAYAAENPGSFELVNYLEWALHNLERAADRVTNICEWVVYAITGDYVEMDSELEAPPSAE